jgi:long-chain acyl-CoA synthetase
LLEVSAETFGRVDRAGLEEAGITILALKDGRGTKAAPGDVETWDVRSLKAGREVAPFQDVSPEDTMTIVYTSGTTARPVGVVHRIADMIDNARLFNRRLGIGPENRFYGILAMTYLGGYYNLLLLPYAGESSVVLANTFDVHSAVNFWRPAIEHGVNTLWLVPTIMSILLEMDRGKNGEEFCRERVRLGLVGTAPLPVPLLREFEKRYGLALFENYGLSETFFISTNAPSLPVLDGSVGRILPGVQVTIVDAQGRGVPYGQEGEILVCTPYLMQGYYNPELGGPDPRSREDWFPTGDIGILSATGDLFITGRKKDLVIRGGINISPAAIENVLHQHPAVAECAVVGIPHSLYGEDIAAVVRLAEGYEFAKAHPELLELCKANLSAIKQPSHLLEIEKFPHSSSGKIQKDKVRELLVHKLGLTQLPAQGTPPATPPTAGTIPGRIRRAFPRPAVEVVEEIGKYPVSIVTDCMNRMGIMDAAIHALVRRRPFCGPAVTVEEVEAGNLMSHAALELIHPGDVLVIDAKGSTTRSCWGGLQTLMAKVRGAAAVVVFGTVRDYEDVVKLGMPVYALGTSPGGPLKAWAGNINYPIACAGVVVNPGDLVMGDDDGVIVVPWDLAERLLPLCRLRRQAEVNWFTRVEAGEATLDVVGLRAKLDQFGVVIE